MGRESRRNKALARLQQQQLQRQLAHGEIQPVAHNGVPIAVNGAPNGAPHSVAAVAMRQQIEASFFSGPIPPPEILAKYEAIVPGSAATIMARVEKQSDHRMALEKVAVTSEVRRANYGLIAAAFISLAILAAGARLIHEGHDAAGAAIVGIDMASVISAFVLGTVKRSKEREKKAQMQAQLARK